MSLPVLTNAVRLSLTLAEGFWDLSIAQAPATCGAALVTISVQSGHASGIIKVQHTAVPSNPQGNHTPNHPCVYRPQSDALALGGWEDGSTSV
jgi:hypothetical protein